MGDLALFIRHPVATLQPSRGGSQPELQAYNLEGDINFEATMLAKPVVFTPGYISTIVYKPERAHIHAVQLHRGQD